jgi:hypothetical protein
LEKQKGEERPYTLVPIDPEGEIWKLYYEPCVKNYELARRAENFGDVSQIVPEELGEDFKELFANPT